MDRAFHRPATLPPGSITGIHRRRLDIFSQLDVPVSEIDEVLPAIVLMHAEVDLNKWTPLRPLRFANEMHPRLLRSSIRLERIALDARADNILPRRWPAAVTGNHMIEIQVVPIEGLPAVLAHVLVALKNVVPCEFDLFLRQMVIDHQQNDARHSNAKRHSADGLRVRFLLGKIVPRAEVICLE